MAGERRQSRRVRTDLDVLVAEAGCVEATGGRLLNLSSAGAWVAMAHPPEAGRRVRLILDRPDASGRVFLHATVEQSLPDGVRLRFGLLDTTAHAVVQELLAICPTLSVTPPSGTPAVRAPPVRPPARAHRPRLLRWLLGA